MFKAIIHAHFLQVLFVRFATFGAFWVLGLSSGKNVKPSWFPQTNMANLIPSVFLPQSALPLFFS